MVKNILILFAIFLAGMALRLLIRKSISDRLTKYLMKGDFASFRKLASGKWASFFLDHFNLYYMRFNAAAAERNREEADLAVENLELLKLNASQKEVFYGNAFYYYAMMKDEEKATLYYERLKENADEEEQQEMSRIFDTYVKGGYAHLEETWEALKTASEDEKAHLEQLLSDMYRNKGDKSNAKKFKELSERHLRELEKRLKEEGQ